MFFYVTKTMFIKFSLINFILIINQSIKVVNLINSDYQKECTKHYFPIEKYFSTKTPYRAVLNKNDSAINYPNCMPIRIWSIIRHGVRNPSKGVIRKAKNRLHFIRRDILAAHKTKLCQHELALFRNWNFNVDEQDAKNLVYEGEYELMDLGLRIQRRFPNLLSDPYDAQLYKFKYTATQRTLRSAESFAIGLFGRHNTNEIMYPEPLHKDPVLRFYKLCDRWIADVDKNPDTLKEKRQFMESIHMQNVINQIENKTGVSGISPNDVELMYTICAFETAWSKRRKSIWCSLFDENTIKVLEFAEDLNYYWEDGYGHSLTYQQACAAFVDMIFHISPDSHYPNSTFYFTHSGTMLKFLSHLGLYKDNFQLTHKDFNRTRQWRTSEIDAFASNLAFITYRCKDDYKILTMHQERIVHLPGCPENEDLCDLDTIKTLFKDSIENCDFENMCQINY